MRWPYRRAVDISDVADLQGRQQTVSGFVQGSCRNVAADFVEVESTGCRTSKVGRIFGFIESRRFAVKR